MKEYTHTIGEICMYKHLDEVILYFCPPIYYTSLIIGQTDAGVEI
jgi:hypothetical protein